jgi:hypothetical protein
MTYRYFVAGFITRLRENIAVRVEQRSLALLLAVLLPSSIAVGLTTLLHSLKGTPEPLRSVLPTLLMAPPAFLWWDGTLMSSPNQRWCEREGPTSVGSSLGGSKSNSSKMSRSSS